MSRYKDVLNELNASDYIIHNLRKELNNYKNKSGYAHFILKGGKEFSHRFADITDAVKVIAFLNENNLVESYMTETK